MGRNRYKVIEINRPHFLTNTVVNWLPIFTRPASVQIILDSWRFLQVNAGLKLYGYVILENHLHWIAQSDDLPRDIARFKSYTARCLLDYLTEVGQYKLLEQFKFYKKAHKLDREFQLWEEGSHAQLMSNEQMLRQKLDYVHLNPVKRGYVDLAEQWRYSSARNYAGEVGLIEVFRGW